MACVEQAAISAVIDIKHIALAQLYLDDNGGAFGDQRTAGLAPEFITVGMRQRIQPAFNRRLILRKRRGCHIGIGGREAAADVDDVNSRARHLAHDVAAKAEGGDVSFGVHGLGAHMEADAKACRYLARGAQKCDGLRGQAAEFVAERHFGIHVGHSKAQQKAKVFAVAGGGHDFVKLRQAVERKVAHAVIKIGVFDGMAAFDRMHKGDMGAGAKRVYLLDFRQRCGVEMTDTGLKQAGQHKRVGVRFDSVKGFAGKILQKPLRRAFQRRGAKAGYWNFGARTSHHLFRTVVIFHCIETLFTLFLLRGHPARRVPATRFGAPVESRLRDPHNFRLYADSIFCKDFSPCAAAGGHAGGHSSASVAHLHHLRCYLGGGGVAAPCAAADGRSVTPWRLLAAVKS